MKFVSVFSVLTVAASLSFAAGAQKTLSCTALDSDVFFKNVSIKMQTADKSSQYPGAVSSQVIGFSADDQKELKLAMKLKDLGNTEALVGSFDIGSDFGSATVSLLDDADRDQVIALIDVSTDGPIQKDIYRCKESKEASKK